MRSVAFACVITAITAQTVNVEVSEEQSNIFNLVTTTLSQPAFGRKRVTTIAQSTARFATIVAFVSVANVSAIAASLGNFANATTIVV